MIYFNCSIIAILVVGYYLANIEIKNSWGKFYKNEFDIFFRKC